MKNNQEVKAFFKAMREEAEHGKTFPHGTNKAYWTWHDSRIESEEDEIVLKDFLWDEEVHDFIETMREAGVSSFIFTNQSTAVMENLHGFGAEGCSIGGLCTIHEHAFYGDKEIKGIRININ